ADGVPPFGRNIVGSGSDGVNYWNVFNVEAENEFEAAFVTYATLEDMFNDENRTGLFIADGGPPFGRNIVGTGALLLPDAPVRVPLPATMWLLGLGITALVAARRLGGNRRSDGTRLFGGDAGEQA